MSYHTSDSLHRLTRERIEERTRDAEAERLAREICRTAHRRRRSRLTLGLALRPSRRAGQARLEA